MPKPDELKVPYIHGLVESGLYDDILNYIVDYFGRTLDYWANLHFTEMNDDTMIKLLKEKRNADRLVVPCTTTSDDKFPSSRRARMK